MPTNIREILRAKLAQTNDEIKRARGELPAQTNRLDPASRAAEMERRNKVAADLNRLAAQDKGIRLALEKVEDDTYGICRDCGGPISPARLAALPWAILCITCQEKQDK
ncbi:MAG: Transcriptional regulator, TraR/DksA family [Candidatus Yanofskybacteria bacterium GW2011_GWF1_44_227]|uniref:Transcriptional regulator, TraR/DksA family n=1 Tax=Candidatus Yanofskybacteria bacterium GW2011_GWE2_40_11 TaxID=1619033 RepID=A0A0G0QIM4_9BACT|nr:MAG: Transcriptional regulator, TraR/DksA family [Candidatus Yanofskybacteria bacterium GW2011_GWE1_40_10]KKR39998.1 MAG: Transcriptional regulator, TraR/DksA family [Candidatus Yanofskybacteria bacterium GW2011_GWE2_40_11]KKT15367.1 MAG: Transcriptional regulator, TraR/DksA family [Candidatus Yanofskybacteria bacterium GW2011_GWF2_43_596]KKT53051.1 MAG: Transcriptional regulator, TraR/DksA family [Candidatus Yanofskybacteria bacterium GW2011_GWF1_44_227]OGN35733.1 MAG: hypothetical protein 